jgi:hypothetical protein
MVDSFCLRSGWDTVCRRHDPFPQNAIEQAGIVEVGASKVEGIGEKCDRRGRNRTCNPRIRNPMLFPFELRAHFGCIP